MTNKNMTNVSESNPNQFNYSLHNTTTNNHQKTKSQQPDAIDSNIIEQHKISLLSERLVIENKRYKIGEIVVRKVIETQMVQVPISREKLIVEQVEPQYKQIAEIDLAPGENMEIIATDSINDFSQSTISSKFKSVHAAVQFLEAIALEFECDTIQVEVVTKSQKTN